MAPRRSTSRQPESEEQHKEAQRAARQAALEDDALREQTRTEVEQRPYLDTEGGE